MSTEDDFAAFRTFPVADASVSLWVFKKRAVAAEENPFRAVSVLLSDTLETALKAVVGGYQQEFGEVNPYDLLAQPNEGGFLGVDKAQTLFPNLEELVSRPANEHQVISVKQLNNAAGYVLRLRVGDTVLFCVKKAAADWQTKKKKGVLNLFFKDATLDVQESPSFSIARTFDFFVFENSILMANKGAFESLLNHRVTYAEEFAALQAEPNFVAAFSNLTPIVQHVGTNAIHLRRMAVIKERAYYNNAGYMQKLRQVSVLRNWGIVFDTGGRIFPTPETVRVIIQVLLDHRLRSELSEVEYDVPSTVAIT